MDEQRTVDEHAWNTHPSRLLCYIASYLAGSLVGRSSSSAQTTGIPWAPTLYIIVTVFSPSHLVQLFIRVWSIIIIVPKVRGQHEDLLYLHPHNLCLAPFHACCRLEDLFLPSIFLCSISSQFVVLKKKVLSSPRDGQL